jgi:hypothetical protein
VNLVLKNNGVVYPVFDSLGVFYFSAIRFGAQSLLKSVIAGNIFSCVLLLIA